MDQTHLSQQMSYWMTAFIGNGEVGKFTEVEQSLPMLTQNQEVGQHGERQLRSVGFLFGVVKWFHNPS